MQPITLRSVWSALYMAPCIVLPYGALCMVPYIDSALYIVPYIDSALYLVYIRVT